jgi:excisionase family DNA binding protein
VVESSPSALVPLEPLAPFFVTAAEAGRVLGLSPTSVYKLLDEGKIESRRHGTRRLVVLASVHDYARRLVAPEDDPEAADSA